jgi:hypothetical protein
MTSQKKQSTEAAVRDIRRRTRRKFSPEEKIRIVLEGLRGEAGYREAAQALAGLVVGRDTYLQFEQLGVVERGRYGRVLAYLFVDGTNVNVEMVRQGWSQFWTKYGRGRYATVFEAAERGLPGLASSREPRQRRTQTACGSKRTCGAMTS